MERYEFYPKTDFNKQGRADFANIICKLLVEKHKGSLTKSIKELEPIYDNFFEHVRNIYELVDYAIPLFCLYELLKNNKEITIENFDFEGDELDYDEVIVKVKKACIDYYIN